MTILFVANAYPPAISGVAISAEHFRTALQKMGHRVLVLTPRYRRARAAVATQDPTATDPDVIRVPAVPNPLYPEYPIGLFVMTPRLLRRLRQAGVQVVHTMQPFTVGRFARRVARRLGVPLVFTHHARYDLYAHYVPLLPRAVATRRVLRSVTRFANSCDALIAPSASTKRFMQEHGITRPITVIPTGLRRSFASSATKEVLRKKTGLPSTKPLLLCVSRISIQDKNLLLLITALPKICAVVPTAQLVLVGGGPDLARLKQITKMHGLAERVRFIGPIRNTELADWYGSADLFVYPSVSETQGIITLEALSAGLPVVATRGPGTIDFVQHDHSGVLTENTAADFAAGVIRVAQDVSLGQRLGQQGQDVAAQYTGDKMAVAQALLYDKVLADFKRTSRSTGLAK
ncbi:MAG: glycosyltransferase [Candidatus Andersenbacteria bacterium]